MKEKDMYELIDYPKFIRIPWCVLETTEWYKWINSPESKVWFRMYKNTIRKQMKSGLGKKIYDEYYKKGLICMRWKQKDMALDIGIKSKGQVSKLINSLAEKGIIKKHIDKWNNKRIIIYEMGTHDKTVSTNENMHLYTYVISTELDNKVDKFK